ncbi:hypothetical protein MLD38_032810 [Melastoma candidum]|uniref:Uncharacterized protein n=1 Tax=Melastoma candidum TaxID=119954 RepID=A0ACB9M549_9MYRT|nr:hypothetical protein MLD38_032810 [Melastoma candidum]
MSKGSMLQMDVKPETSQIRPYIVCAVLRGMKFDEARYNSFIEVQDMMHQNICRIRALFTIGTHVMDTVEGPFSYEERSFKANDLMEYYKSYLKLKKFLHIIENSLVFPVIYNKNRLPVFWTRCS